jgi:hypothetical protein
VAVEADRAACQHARGNLSALKGATVECGPTDRVLRSGFDEPFDLVVLDPPREGAKRTVVEQVVDRRPRAVAYVACDPAAMPGAVAVFSALDADVAGDVEAAFRDAGVAGARGRRCDAVARRAPPPATSTARSAAASLPQSFPTRATSAWWPTCRWWCRPSTAATWSSCARRRRLRPAAASVRAHARARGDGGERARAYALFDTPLSPQS